MALARIVFEQKKLRKRYGVAGYIAGRYVEAGYSVVMEFPTPKGKVSFVAKRSGEVLAVDVVNGSVKLGKDHVEAIAEKAAAINAKPVLALYGSGPVVTEEAKAAAKEKNVVIKRFR